MAKMAKMARLGVEKLMEWEDLARLERFDRMERRSNTCRYEAVSRGDYAASLRPFSRPVGGVTSFNESETEESQ